MFFHERRDKLRMPDMMPVLREPKKTAKGSRKLLAILLLLFAILLAVLFFRSPISKISEIAISGGQYLSTEAILDAVGVKEGVDSYFYPSEASLAKRIAKLAPVESVVVRKNFPGKLDIQVHEFPAVAFELMNTGEITAILSNGTVLTAGSNFVVDKPVLSGWMKDDPNKAKLIKALAAIPDDLLTDFSEIMPYPSNSYKDRIKIYTRTKFEIITAVSLLPDKAETIHAVIETQEPGSLTMLLSDRYVPYIDENGTEGDQEEAGG